MSIPKTSIELIGLGFVVCISLPLFVFKNEGRRSKTRKKRWRWDTRRSKLAMMECLGPYIGQSSSRIYAGLDTNTPSIGEDQVHQGWLLGLLAWAMVWPLWPGMGEEESGNEKMVRILPAASSCSIRFKIMSLPIKHAVAQNLASTGHIINPRLVLKPAEGAASNDAPSKKAPKKHFFANWITLLPKTQHPRDVRLIRDQFWNQYNVPRTQ